MNPMQNAVDMLLLQADFLKSASQRLNPVNAASIMGGTDSFVPEMTGHPLLYMLPGIGAPYGAYQAFKGLVPAATYSARQLFSMLPGAQTVRADIQLPTQFLGGSR